MIDWSKIRHFKPDEFPEDPDAHAEPALITTLDHFRERLGVEVWPSKAKGALARNYGSPESRHYAVNRLSDAVDVFINMDPRAAWIRALRFGWGGVGIYFDTHIAKGRPMVMFHLDLRPRLVYWYRSRGRYGHPMVNQVDLADMFKLLADGGPI